MSPKRRQDRNAFLLFLAIMPLALLVAPLPFLRVAAEKYAVQQQIARNLAAQQRAAVGGTAQPPAAKEAAER